MAKLVLADIENLENEASVVATLNANSALIEAALEKTLTRDDNTNNPNSMSVDLQMGGKKITGLATPTASSDAVTKAYVDASTGNDIGDITAAVAQAEAAAADAEAAALEAQAAATGYNSTSTTSNSIATGTKTFTVETDKSYTSGQYVIIVEDGTPANSMFGQITSYDENTGELVVDVTVITGSGTISDWAISLSGPRGATGASGSGSGDVSAPGGNFAASGRVLVSAGTDKTVDDTTVAISGSAVSSVTTLGMSGTLTNSNAGAVLTATGSDASINLGATGASNSPVVNFRSSGSTTNYDARLIATGGSSSDGTGTLTATAATFAVSGNITEGGNPVINTAGGDNLTGGFTTTSYAMNSGTISTGSHAINPLNGYIQHYSNTGAHTLTAPVNPGVCIIQVTNGVGSGAINLNAFKLTGDTYNSTQGRVYELTVRKLNSYAVMNVLRIDV